MASTFNRRRSFEIIGLLLLCCSASPTPMSNIAHGTNWNLDLSPIYTKIPFHGANLTGLPLGKAQIRKALRGVPPDEYIERLYDNPEFCCTGQYALPCGHPISHLRLQ